MRRLFFLVCALLLASTTAFAIRVNVPPAAPVVSLDIPAAWKSGASKRGVGVRSPDEKVYFWVEVYQPNELAEVSAEHLRYFAKEDVVATGEPSVVRKSEDGVKVEMRDFPATWKGKPTVLRYFAVDPGLTTGHQILISYWASPEGDEIHGPAFRTIVKSLASAR